MSKYSRFCSSLSSISIENSSNQFFMNAKWFFFYFFTFAVAFSLAPDILNKSTMGQPPSNWKMESGYKSEIETTNQYPYRVFGTGKQASVHVILRVLNDDIENGLCSGAVNGFKITFHPPNEVPQISKKYIQISPGKQILFKINPSLIISLANIHKYSPVARQCYFQTERKLRFFNGYTQRSCELECMANFTLAECGCVRFFMPSKNNI